MPVKKIFRRMLAMCPAAWRITLASLRIGCLLLAAALLLLAAWRADPVGSRILYIRAHALNERCQALRLVSMLAAAIVEAQHTARSHLHSGARSGIIAPHSFARYQSE